MEAAQRDLAADVKFTYTSFRGAVSPASFRYYTNERQQVFDNFPADAQQ